MSFCHTKTVKARKPHVCAQCGRIIEVGVIHNYTVGVDGDFFWFREHSDCAEAWRDLNSDALVDDGAPFLRDDPDLVQEYTADLMQRFPSVASRLGIGGAE